MWASSVVLCLTLMVTFWMVYPYTIAPIEFLLNSFVAMLLGRVLTALLGGGIGFALPFVVLFWPVLSTGMRPAPSVGGQQTHEEERNVSVLNGDNRVTVSNVDSNEGETNTRPNPSSDNRLSETLGNQNMTSPSKAMNSADLVTLKLAELQGDLAVVNSKIESERKRWLDANATINALTNNKTTPVVRNSPDHVKMYESQVVMKQVEAGAPSLKAEKSRLEAMIKSLQESASSLQP